MENDVIRPERTNQKRMRKKIKKVISHNLRGNVLSRMPTKNENSFDSHHIDCSPQHKQPLDYGHNLGYKKR